MKSLIGEDQEPGYYQAAWNGKSDNGHSVASGVYVYRLRSGEYVSTRKLLVMR